MITFFSTFETTLHWMLERNGFCSMYTCPVEVGKIPFFSSLQYLLNQALSLRCPRFSLQGIFQWIQWCAFLD